MNFLDKISKKFSYYLRHCPEDAASRKGKIDAASA